jgi:LysM repeat protein
MKRISFLVVALVLAWAPAMRGQDAATQERLDKLTGEIQNLTEAQAALRKQISDLSRELQNLREQAIKPNGSYARAEDLSRLAEDIKTVDRKRLEDAEMVRTELLKLRKAIEAPLSQRQRSRVSSPKDTPTAGASTAPQRGFEYVIQSGDTLDAIVQAYRDKDIRVTVAQILKANPGLVPERMQIGQKIFIPAP